MTRIPRGFGMPATPDRRTPPPSLPRQVNSGVRRYQNLSSLASRRPAIASTDLPTESPGTS